MNITTKIGLVIVIYSTLFLELNTDAGRLVGLISGIIGTVLFVYEEDGE